MKTELLKKVIFKKSLLVFILVLITLFNYPVNAKSITLEEIANTFNSSKLIEGYSGMFGWDLTASVSNVDSNVLQIAVVSDAGNTSLDYVLDDNILINNHLIEDYQLTAYFLADSIGQLHGYEEGDLITNFTLFFDEIAEYSVEEEGFEIIENEGYSVAKLDITKKIPLIDESNFYLKPTDFDILQDILDNEGVGNQTGKTGKLAYNVSVDEDNNSIYIGEEGGLTQSAYKSILSALEVMYGEKVVEYFQEVFPNFDEGSLITEGFDIDVDIEVDLEESPIFTNTTVLKVIVDNDYIKDAFLRTEYIGETVDHGDKTISIDFRNNHVYKLGFFDSVSSSDVAFFYKYILESIYVESGVEIVDNTAYFNITDGKIVVGDKDNNMFKIVVGEDSIDLVPTNTDNTIKTLVINIDDVKTTEYTDCDYGHGHYRYGKYNLTINISFNDMYRVLEGANQTVDSSKNEDLIFKFDIDYEQFLEEGVVYLDGQEVDSSHYIVKQGSTIITFKSDYVKTLTNKEHTVKVVMSDGEVSTNFMIVGSLVNPQTNDSIYIYVITFVIGLIGLLSVGLFSMKKKYN